MYTSHSSIRPLNGIYQVDNTLLDDYQQHWKMKLLWQCSIVYLICVVLALRNYTETTFFYLLVFTVVLYGSLLVYWFVSNPRSPFEHTIIEIRDHTIYRYGKGLVPVQIPLDAIGKIVERPDGMVLIRKGIWGVVSFYADQRGLSGSSHAIYIPSMLNRYEELKTYVRTLEDPRAAYVYVQ